MDRKECRIDRPARMYVRCIGTVGAVDVGCHRLAEQSVGGNGRRRHCPHRSQFPQRPVDAGYLRLPHVQLLSERNVLAFSGSRADLDGVHERTSHGLRQRGPFGFGPRAAARGTQGAARDRGRARTTSSRRRTAVGSRPPAARATSISARRMSRSPSISSFRATASECIWHITCR